MGRLIYLVGAPGAGKSTLMARMTKKYLRTPHGGSVPHDSLVNPRTGDIVAGELGRQRGQFSGTDALAMNIITKAIPWIGSCPYPLVLGEGARLANMRFLNAAAHPNGGSRDVLVVHVEHDDTETWRAARSAQLGREQTEAWVKGRTTAARNLAAAAQDAGHRVFRGHPDYLADILEPWFP